MAAEYKTLHPVKYYRDFLAQDVRPDGRTLSKARTTTVNVGSVNTADGSAIARIGNTTVICGIKAELGKPKAEEPDCGFLVPNVELPPLCSPLFRSGPPSEQAQALTSYVAEATSNILDRKQLCVSLDNLVWVLHIDMICLDYDGSVQDACVMAMLAALRSVNLPEVEFDVETKAISVDDKKRNPLTISNSPVCSSFAIFDDEIILTDPMGEEEKLASGLLSIVSDGEHIFSVHKPGGSALDENKLQECVKRARNRALLIIALIDTAINSPDR